MSATIQHEVQQNGVAIVRTKTGIGVAVFVQSADDPLCNATLTIEVENEGRLIKREQIVPRFLRKPWRDYYQGMDMLRCVVRVKDGSIVLAELGHPEAPLPFMVLQGEQRHITEAYVSIPPALTITDEGGNVWTLGFKRADQEDSPHGELAFGVLRNGVDTGIIASRIERRSGKVRAFTKSGWQVWNGRFWF